MGKESGHEDNVFGFDVPEHVVRELGETAGNASIAGDLIGSAPEPDNENTPESATNTAEWARENIELALLKWRQNIQWQGDGPHWRIANSPVPENFDALAAGHPNFDQTFTTLCAHRQTLMSYGHGTDLTLDFVLVPWRFFAEEIQNINPDSRTPDLYYTLTELHGGLQDIEIDIMNNLGEDAVRYYGVEAPESYLARKMQRDGNWGLLLMQTDDEAGLTTKGGFSPTLVNLEASRDLKIHGIQSNKLGVFELLAYMLQEPRIIEHDELWLPINDFTNDYISNPNASHLSRAKRLKRIIQHGSGALDRQVRLAIDADDS